jgi:cytochrome c peroxidase
MVSSESSFDSAFMNGSIPDFSVLTPQARQGGQLFSELGCANCHRTSAHFTDDPRNTGLALAAGDSGAGRGRFKAPSLRNVGVRPPYMHVGRFATLEQVVEFYDTGVQVGPDLDLRMRNPDGSPRRLKLSAEQRAALVAFLHALTDRAFLQAPRFSDPFVETRVAP